MKGIIPSTMLFSYPIQKNILRSLPNIYTSPSHLCVSALSPPSRWTPAPPYASSSESPAWNLILKHFPYFRSSFSPRFNHRITSVSFLHFPHKGVLSSGAPRHSSFEETVFLHYFLIQPTSPKNEGTFQELAENVHPSLP